MDLNQSIEFNPSSTTAPKVHNFMLPYHQPSKRDCEEASHSRFMQTQKQNLEIFWKQRLLEIQNASELKSTHQLPLARIKRIMKSDRDVKMIAADTPILFSKACELFILELTLRSWLFTEEFKRRTLQRCDIARAIKHDDILDFLVDFVPNPHHSKENDEAGNSIEETGNQVAFPIIDNENMPNQEIPQQISTRPSMSYAEFNYESGFKWAN